MAVVDMTVVIKAEDTLTRHLDEMRQLAARMEAAAAAMGKPIEGELIELQPAMATLRPAAPEVPLLGPLAVAVMAGAALAGSTTKRLTRRSLLTLGFIRNGER